MTSRIDVRGPASIDEAAEQVMVKMRDGVRLATDLYLPPNATPRAAVLVRLPYDKSGRYTFMPTAAPWFLERGYAFVVQDVRGKFRSEGETVPYVHEVHDGYDTIDWITNQPWCDGRVGMFGDSYYGWTQWAAVASGHHALRAIVPRMTCVDLGTIRVQTTWHQGIVPLYAASYFAHHWVGNDDYDFDIDWSVRPLAEVFDEIFKQIGARARAFDAMVSGRRPWVPFTDGHPFDAREVPALHAVGWFDNVGPDSMRDFMTLQGHGRTLQYLVADSTDHENYSLADTPINFESDHDVNDAALERLLPRYLGPALDFLDAFLKDGETPTLPPRVRWHIGNGDWHAAERWPAPESTRWRLYLDDAPRATGGSDGGLLTPRAAAAVSRSHWTHDPAHLVPSTVENPFALLYELPDEASVHGRPDVATFTTEPWEQPIELAGAVQTRLMIGCSAATTHVYAKLCDVAPTGEALMLARGQTHVSTASRDEVPISVYMGHVGHRLQPGHRLRLHVDSSDFPLYLPLFDDAANPWQARSSHAVGQTLRVGGALASFVDVDVMGDAPG